MLLTAICIQTCLLMLCLFWVRIVKPKNCLRGLTTLIAVAILIAGIGLIGLWFWPPKWVYYFFVVLFGVLGLPYLRKLNRTAGTLPNAVFYWPAMMPGILGILLITSGLKGRVEPITEAIELRPPLAMGEQHCVLSGGASLGVNLHYLVGPNGALNEEVHSIDFIKLNKGVRTTDNQLFHPKPIRPEHYAIYGSAIYAPCDGEVIGVEARKKDQLAGHRFRDRSGSNHVTLNCSGINVMLAHMQPNSTQLETGDKVRAGDKIGLVGNTGNTEEPHLHIHAFKETRSEGAVQNKPVTMRFNGEYLSRGECL